MKDIVIVSGKPAPVLYELHRRSKRYGREAACIGGGQGIAMIVEAI